MLGLIQASLFRVFNFCSLINYMFYCNFYDEKPSYGRPVFVLNRWCNDLILFFSIVFIFSFSSL